MTVYKEIWRSGSVKGGFDRAAGSVCKEDCLLRALYVKRVICKEYCCKDHYLIGKNNIGGDNLIKHNIR